MCPGENHYGPRQPKRASWSRIRWHSEGGKLTQCCWSGPSRPAGSKPSPSGWGGAEPRGARLGLAGRTVVSSCMAGPLSDPKEGEMRWREVAENSDRPEGSTLLPPSPPWWGGGRGTWLQGGWVEPTPWVRGRGLLTTGVSSELRGLAANCFLQLSL
jgi:hypothetical protein